MRTASEIVNPTPSNTSAARSFTPESIRVCTNAFAAMFSLLANTLLL
jgi:hypothetical protein